MMSRNDGDDDVRRWRDWSNVKEEKENENRLMTDGGRDECKLPGCENPSRSGGVDPHANRFCSDACEVKHDHLRDDARDARRSAEEEARDDDLRTDGGYTFGGPTPANPERCPDCERLVSRTVNGNRCPYCREETFEDDGSVMADGGATVNPDDEGVEILTDGGEPEPPRCPNDEELLEPQQRGGDAMLECPECGYQCGDPLTPARRRYRELQTEYHTLIDRHQRLKSEGMTERADELLGAINAIEELLNDWNSANIKERK